MTQLSSNTAFAANTSSFSANTAFNDNTPSNRSVVPQILPPDALVPKPQVDPPAIRSFCKLWYSFTKGTSGTIVLAYQTVHPELGKEDFEFEHFETGKPSELKRLQKRAVNLATRPWTNVFYSSYVAKIGTRARGTRDDVHTSLMLVVDRDDDTGKQGTIPLDPSLVVRTSYPKTKNAQAVYVFDPSCRPSVAEADSLGKKLRATARADSATGDISHMYRVPGTLNWPTVSKLKRGRSRVATFAFLETAFSGYVDTGHLSLVLDGVPPEEAKQPIPGYDGDLATLVGNLPEPLQKMLQRAEIKGDRSAAAWAALRALVEVKYSKPEVKALILAHPAGVGARYLADHTKLDADIHRAFAKVESTPTWDEVYGNGRPKQTYTNALLGLHKMDAEFSFNEFSHRDLLTCRTIDLEGVDVRDGHISRLREEFRLKFGFDPSLRSIEEAVKLLCQEGAFHPVRDYLDSLKWDGKCRLNTWLHTYLGAEHNDYVASVGLIVLVAAVRRIYEPGTKFDTILVLEGNQGTGKSTALVILAGKDNHSDNEILAMDTRTQMEAMEGIWLFEIGELSGMRKAEIGKIKAFASRSTDRGRAAYARYSERRDRQCVFIGTTNDDEYLRCTASAPTGQIELIA